VWAGFALALMGVWWCFLLVGVVGVGILWVVVLGVVAGGGFFCGVLSCRAVLGSALGMFLGRGVYKCFLEMFGGGEEKLRGVWFFEKLKGRVVVEGLFVWVWILR